MKEILYPEEWRAVPEDMYDTSIEVFEVSSRGRLRHADTHEAVSISTNRKGYKAASLSGSHVIVHRAVAIAFIENPHGKEIVHHIDENPSNNNVANLKWVTPKEHSYENRINERKNISQRRLYAQVDPNDSTIKNVFYSLEDIRLKEAGFDHYNVSKATASYTPYNGFMWIKGANLDELNMQAKYGKMYLSDYPWLIVYHSGVVYNTRRNALVKPSYKKLKNGGIKTVYIDVYDAKLFPDRKGHLKRVPIKQFIGSAVFTNYDPMEDAIANLDGNLENNAVGNLEVVKGAKHGFNQVNYNYRRAHPRNF